ncbi:MAG: fibronectin type III domain-containing protein [Saprospiraceae bacterium]|nr:fibronectin type III domain-containing protein [Saprospiraceae bacterium]
MVKCTSTTYGPMSGNFTYSTVMDCLPPTNLTFTSITNTGFTANWTAPFDVSTPAFSNYTVVVYNVDFPNTAVATLQPTGTSQAITGLLAGTNYRVEVRSKCGTANSTRIWKPVTTTNTACALSAPTLGNATNVTNTSVTLNWTTVPTATKYEVRYRKLGSYQNYSTASTTSGTATSINLSSLTLNTIYEYNVRSYCSSTAAGKFGSTASFTTTGSAVCAAQNGFSSDAATANDNIVNINLTGSTYALPYIFGVCRNHVKDHWSNTEITDYRNFQSALMMKYRSRITSPKKLYRHGGTMTDGNQGCGWFCNYKMYGFDYDLALNTNGPYPYDQFLNYTTEANSANLNADLLVTVNFGSGTPQKAANLVTNLRNQSLLSKAKFFELGNEIEWQDQLGHGDKTALKNCSGGFIPLSTFFMYCPNCPCMTNPTSYDLSDKASSPTVYGKAAANYISQMVTAAAGSGVKLKIGLVIGHDSEMKGNNIEGSYGLGWSQDVDVNIKAIMTELKNAIGEYSSNNLENSVDIFFTYHGYGGWPLLNGANDPGSVTLNLGGCNYDYSNNAKIARSFLAAGYNAEKRIREKLYTNVSCKTDKLFKEKNYQWNGNAVKIGLTEFSTHMSTTARPALAHSVTEALFMADNMVNAMKMDMEMAVAYSLHHLGNFPTEDIADNLFFGDFNPNETGYTATDTTKITEKACFKVQDFLDNWVYNTVVANYDGTSTLHKTTDIFLRPDAQGQVCSNPSYINNFKYPSLSYVLTSTTSPTGYALVVINKSDQLQKISSLNVPGFNSSTATRKTISAAAYTATSFTNLADANYTSNASGTFTNVEIPPLSINVIRMIPGGGGGGGTCAAITATGGTGNITVSNLNVTGAANRIIKVWNSNWSAVVQECNSFNNNPTCSSPTHVFSGIPAGSYHVALQIFDANNVEICNRIIDVAVSFTGSANDRGQASENLAPDGQRTISLYPNPVSGELFINLDVSFDENTSWYILNSTGQIVMDGIIGAGQTGLVIDASTLASGVHIFGIRDASEQGQQAKFVVQK